MGHKKGKKKHDNRQQELTTAVLVLQILRLVVEIVGAIIKNLTD